MMRYVISPTTRTAAYAATADVIYHRARGRLFRENITPAVTLTSNRGLMPSRAPPQKGIHRGIALSRHSSATYHAILMQRTVTASLRAARSPRMQAATPRKRFDDDAERAVTRADSAPTR